MLAPRKLGLSGGFGDCPGDPTCPGYVIPGSSDYTNSLLDQLLANQNNLPAAPVPPAVPFDLMGFFSKYGTVIGLALSAAVVLPHLFATGGRR
jgi:hypothetical protein